MLYAFCLAVRIWIKRRLRSHGEHLARFGLHDERGSLFRPKLLHRPLQGLFGFKLDVRINGEVKTRAVFRLFPEEPRGENREALGVLRTLGIARLAPKEFFIVFFEAVLAFGFLILITQKAERMGQELAVRVEPPRVFFCPDALYPKTENLFFCLKRDAARQGFERVAGL